MLKLSTITFVLFLTSFCLSQSNYNVAASPFTIGERLQFNSQILNEKRILNIYLPNGYSADSARTYPVIYLLDGSKDEDFIHISGIVQFASYPWIEIMQESIVVGIENVDRKKDYTFPTTIKQDKIDFPTTGGSEKFIEFLQKEVVEIVEEKYKTKSGNSTLIGQSLGGLLATEILINHDSIFDNYIIVSPSLWWNNQSLLETNTEQKITNKKIFIAVGEEGKIMKRDAKSLYKELQKRIDDSSEVSFKFYKEQNHGDVLHLAVYDAFVQLFRQKKN